MQEHTMTLRDDELKLVRRIREMDSDTAGKRILIDQLIQEIENFLAAQPSQEIRWLQVGENAFLQSIEPVKPEAGSPLASQIIIEQRQRNL